MEKAKAAEQALKAAQQLVVSPTFGKIKRPLSKKIGPPRVGDKINFTI